MNPHTSNDIPNMLLQVWSERGQGHYDKAGELLKKAHSLCAVNDYEHLGRVFHIYAQFESDHDNYKEALKLYQKSQAYYVESGNQDKIAHSTRHIADVQRTLGKLNDAEDNYRNAISIYKSETNTHKGNLANALRGFAICLEQNGKIDEAIATFEETRDLYVQCGLKAGVEEAEEKLKSLGN